MLPDWWEQIARPIQKQLNALSFEPEKLEDLRQQILSGRLSKNTNYCSTMPVSPKNEDLIFLPEHGSYEYSTYYEMGCHAIAAGKVGMAILNGGMATRFGGVVKGAVVVYNNRSFLQLKLDNVRSWQQRFNARIPVFVVNSFATDAATRDHLKEEEEVEIHYLQQGVSLRLTPEGEIFWHLPGQPSLYAPGHGDMLRAWRASPAAMEWSREEGRILLIGNVDNLHYSINPAIIGMLMNQRQSLLVENVVKYPGDMGGAPAWVNNRLQAVEGFRFPPAFDQSTIGIFATNNFAIRAEKMIQPWQLDWFYVLKEAHNRKLLQLEQIINQITEYLDSTFIVVPRTGIDGRFLPVKTIDDMSFVRRAFMRRGTQDI